MTATESANQLLGINSLKLSTEERLLLEAELFLFICKEIKEFFRNQYKNYFRLMRFSRDREDAMLDANFISLVIKDILRTEEYTMEGVARYTGTHEDVVYEVVSGINRYPSAVMLQKTIELHRSVRRDLYNAIVKKFYSEAGSLASEGLV